MFNFKRKLNSDELEQYKLNIISRFVSEDYLDVINICDLVLRFNPNDTNILYSKARSLIILKKYQETLPLLNKILEIKPDMIDALESKMVVLDELKKYEEVKSVFYKIRELDPNNRLVRKYNELKETLGIPLEQVDEKYQKYSILRKQIEQMPIYERWRQDVINKCRNRCQMCGTNNNLEVHHRVSFYLLLKQHNITLIEQAFENKYLWNIDNGEVLCKECHDKMESSKNRETIISKNKS